MDQFDVINQEVPGRKLKHLTIHAWSMGDTRTAKAESVSEILARLDPIQRKIADRLRKLIRRTLPESVETVKWWNITYLLGSKNLAWLLFYKNHVDFGFFMGARLKSKRLEGTGKGLRHVKIADLDEIDEKEFSRLLHDAAKLTVKCSQ
ncbi:MAG: DUF1801 domain-containing protein [Candidatus Bathyarchaeia archaeon]